MRALLLAAGFGTRLRPLTETIPKCLVPVLGRPLLEIWLDRLSQAGVSSFLINTHYLSQKVESFIDGSPFKKIASLIHEPTLLGTAATLRVNLDFFQGADGMLIHADNYCMADFNCFMQAHIKRPKECLLTMMTFRTNQPSNCGIVELDERGVVVGFHEKVSNPPDNLANGAVYIFSPEFIKILVTELSTAKDFSTEVLNFLIGRIYSYETTEVFIDVGTPESYKIANAIQ